MSEKFDETVTKIEAAIKKRRNYPVSVKNSKMVAELMKMYRQPIATKPTLPTPKVARLRLRMIVSEVWELIVAMWNRDLVEIADALTDILVFVYGMGLTYGIDLDACFREVHRSNKTKLGYDGEPIYRADGKVMKGPNYQPPNLKKVMGI